MKELEKYINLHKNEPYTIENLPEKSRGEYIDYKYKTNSKYKIFDQIAEDLSIKFVKYHFSDSSDDYTHPSISCDDKLSKKLGVDSIILCPYKGYEISENDILHERFESNYILMTHPNNDLEGEEQEKSVLYIDLYNTFKKTKTEIYQHIYQELYNLKRDLNWVNKGVYEEKMLDMADKALEIQHKKMMEDPIYHEIFESLEDIGNNKKNGE